MPRKKIVKDVPVQVPPPPSPAPAVEGPQEKLMRMIRREGRFRMLYMVTDLLGPACDSQHEYQEFVAVCPPGTRVQAETVRRLCLAMITGDPRRPFPAVDESRFEGIIHRLRQRLPGLDIPKMVQAQRVIDKCKARCRPIWDARVQARKEAAVNDWMAIQ